MKIVFLDRASIGTDTPVEIINKFGETAFYDSSEQDEIVDRAKDADVIILNKVKIPRDIMEQLPALKLICIFATGFDNIDVEAAGELGVAVCNVPGYSSDSVALYTVSTVLALVTHLFEYNSYVRDGSYTLSGVPNKLTPVYHELAGKTWGIVGYGNIGKTVAKIASAFEVKIIVNKRTPIDEAVCVDIDTLCSNSDIITIHCPLNDETRHMINKEKIALMKKNVIIVNEARGAVVNEAEIADAIINGEIGSFGSDVYSKEPFGTDHPFNKIKDYPNVILTPHAAWGSYEARSRCINIVADNIASFIDGKMLNRVDKKKQNI